MFIKIGVLRNFTILTEKHLYLSLFLLKRDSNKETPTLANIAKFLQTAFLYRTLLMAASKLKSNIVKVNLKISNKKLFLHFDNSHTNQTNTTKKI